ncbi:pili assembly chaperone [Caballeronia arationis]|uniref:P pilus assembly protein, chaperone PapD n=2 Tax=Caballeronia arationis TaxID=1777142 RepID=A0A7Z7I4G8_9BURK|nr:fimbria/pilus periplasmic chaperone [Caballeronia arationis]SAK84656.1 pili assembly chaperone [Caballeronia arationis]SOE61926.1 P pilus assembly protein, chaperone PapD [Caballeronia arationis]
MKSLTRIACALGVAAALFAGSAAASVTVGGTRVVYPLENREVTVKLDNDRAEPSLVQVWMDSGDVNAKPDEASAPFVLTPPIFRMDGHKAQTLRIMYTGDSLPQDRESVFWLNVLDVPPKAKATDENTLQFAFRTRIKVFARPKDLPGTPADAAQTLTWKIVPSPDNHGYAVAATNPSAYHVSFNEIDVVSGDQTFRNEAGGMVGPKGSAVFPVKNLAAVPAGAKVKFTTISDYGGATPHEAPLGE